MIVKDRNRHIFYFCEITIFFLRGHVVSVREFSPTLFLGERIGLSVHVATEIISGFNFQDQSIALAIMYWTIHHYIKTRLFVADLIVSVDKIYKNSDSFLKCLQRVPRKVIKNIRIKQVIDWNPHCL